MYTKSGNHGKLLMCVHAARMYRLFDVVLLRFPTISSVTTKGGIYTCSAHWLDYSPTRSIFFASSVLYEFYRWSISFARDLHRLPIANMSHCINTTSNCSFVPHAVHFHMELLNFYSVLCFFLSIFVRTYCYYCLQSHPNSLSTHDVHNATLKQWHFDMSRVS